MGQLTISMAIFNSYVNLPEGKWDGGTWWDIPFGKLTVSYGKWSFLYDITIEYGNLLQLANLKMAQSKSLIYPWK